MDLQSYIQLKKLAAQAMSPQQISEEIDTVEEEILDENRQNRARQLAADRAARAASAESKPAEAKPEVQRNARGRVVKPTNSSTAPAAPNRTDFSGNARGGGTNAQRDARQQASRDALRAKDAAKPGGSRNRFSTRNNQAAPAAPATPKTDRLDRDEKPTPPKTPKTDRLDRDEKPTPPKTPPTQNPPSQPAASSQRSSQPAASSQRSSQPAASSSQSTDKPKAASAPASKPSMLDNKGVNTSISKPSGKSGMLDNKGVNTSISKPGASAAPAKKPQIKSDRLRKALADVKPVKSSKPAPKPSMLDNKGVNTSIAKPKAAPAKTTPAPKPSMLDNKGVNTSMKPKPTPGAQAALKASGAVLNNSVDLSDFDVILEHLMEQGFPQDEALKLMVNMTEEKREQILENRRAARAAGGYVDDGKKQPDPSKPGFTGTGNMSIKDIMKMNKDIEARDKKKTQKEEVVSEEESDRKKDSELERGGHAVRAKEHDNSNASWGKKKSDPDAMRKALELVKKNMYKKD